MVKLNSKDKKVRKEKTLESKGLKSERTNDAMIKRHGSKTLGYLKQKSSAKGAVLVSSNYNGFLVDAFENDNELFLSLVGMLSNCSRRSFEKVIVCFRWWYRAFVYISSCSHSTIISNLKDEKQEEEQDCKKNTSREAYRKMAKRRLKLENDSLSLQEKTLLIEITELYSNFISRRILHVLKGDSSSLPILRCRKHCRMKMDEQDDDEKSKEYLQTPKLEN